ncbi:MAG: ABC transporter permease [Chitinophagaceae bacterium]
MLRNYILIAWRNLTKNRFYSTINILGLSTGIAFTLLIGAYVWSQLQVNTQLRHADRQCILLSKWKDPNMGYEIASIAELAGALKREYPNLVANYYHWDGITSNVSYGDKHFREGLQVGDSTFLTTYGFKLLYGDAKTALNDPFSIVITAAKAKKYFGKTDVVGQSLNIESFSGSKHDFVITAVMENPSANSVTWLTEDNKNELFLPMAATSFFGRNVSGWNAFNMVSLVELQPGVKPADLNQPIQQLMKQHASPFAVANLTPYAVALKDYYLTANNGLVRKMLYALSVIALFILLMAIINFINMAVSRSSSRIKEIGIRKVMGSLRKQLVWQFLIESVLLVFFATLVAGVIYILAAPFFSTMLGKSLPAIGSFPLYFILFPAALIVVTGVLAGLYPAFILSSLKSVDAVKGKLAGIKENVLLRKSLVTFQFVTAAVVLTGAYIISQQMSLFFGKSLGFNKEYVVAAQVPRNWTPQGVQHMEDIRRQFAALPQVSDVTLSYEVPDGKNSGSVSLYKAGSDSTSANTSLLLYTDEYYTKTYDIPMAAGDFYSTGAATDTFKVVINEAQAKALGYGNVADAVGKQVKIQGAPPLFTIAGVTRDFHFGSMQKTIQPVTFLQVKLTNTFRYLSFKLRAGNIGKDLEALQTQWSALLPGAAFEYRFMDDVLKQLYQSEMQLQKASYAATVLSIIIVLLGVTGLVSLSIQKRTREIGIRKVLGSSITGIIQLFLKEFVTIIILACIIACPVAYLIMQHWLDGYAYRISITAQPYIITIGALILVTVALIVAQTIKTALASPVKSLRTD